jgi:uncharacterized membrane protein
MPHWRWLLAQLTRQLWVRATSIGALGVLAAILAAVVDRYVPFKMPIAIDADAINSILTIIASSMLAVTSFSLSIMVSAYSAATTNVTPRATRLIVEDKVTHIVLSTFIGAFLFGIVGLVVLKTGIYGQRGRGVLFAFTIIVIALVVVSLLRWIDHLTRLGRLADTTHRVEQATCDALKARLAAPYLGGRPLQDAARERPADAMPVAAGIVGYVKNIDMAALSQVCARHEVAAFVQAIPGTFVYAHTPLAWVARPAGDVDEEALGKAVCRAFLVGDERSFDQDPRFGLAVMGEIASRALSPAVNDPGTAIDVIGRLTRLLSLWASGRDATADPRHPRVHVPPLATADLFEDAFMALARDGASLIEVQLRLQKGLLALSRMGDEAFRTAALAQSTMAAARAEAGLNLAADRDRLRREMAAGEKTLAAQPAAAT